MHHPTSSCTDNMVRDSGMGGAMVAKKRTGVCLCVWEKGGRWLGVSSLTFLSPLNPSYGLHLRKWSVYSAPWDKANTWDVKTSNVSKPTLNFIINMYIKKELAILCLSCICSGQTKCPFLLFLQRSPQMKENLACRYVTTCPCGSTSIHLERTK